MCVCAWRRGAASRLAAIVRCGAHGGATENLTSWSNILYNKREPATRFRTCAARVKVTPPAGTATADTHKFAVKGTGTGTRHTPHHSLCTRPRRAYLRHHPTACRLFATAFSVIINTALHTTEAGRRRTRDEMSSTSVCRLPRRQSRERSLPARESCGCGAELK